jgi:predicted GH43/DUF377 family glycosyl hydrolase
MKWKKLGKIFESQENYPWMRHHAANPCPIITKQGLWRVYISPRDEKNESCISFVEIDPKQNFKVVSISDRPLIEKGDLGMFDDSGTSVGCIISFNNKFLMYYLGWNIMKRVPFFNTIGLAISDDGKNFRKYSKAPIIQRSEIDPITISYPYVIQENNKLLMCYGSHVTWNDGQKQNMKHIFHYAESTDGIHWDLKGPMNFKLRSNEIALTKPLILKEDGMYKMFYSYSVIPFNAGGNGYRIGYAESLDFVNWVRKDEDTGIDVSESGWDSEIICYPNILDFEGARYMFYNGNGYGASGFGIAILEHA